MAHKRKRRTGPRSDREFEARNRTLKAGAIARGEGKSLSVAAREAETTPDTILKYTPASWQKKGRKWVVTGDDRYIRYLQIPGEHGPVIIRVKGYKEAQVVSAYISSLKRWLRTGKVYELAPFHGKRVGLEQVELITASRTLQRMADHGLLRLETLYASLRGVA